MGSFAHIVGAKSASWRSGVCDAIRPHSKSPTLQITHVTIRHVTIRPYYKFTHVTNCPHVEGLIAISPYTCVYWTFTNIHVNTQKSITGMVWVLLRTL